MSHGFITIWCFTMQTQSKNQITYEWKEKKLINFRNINWCYCFKKIWREMHTRPSKFIEIPVWRFPKIIPTHSSVSIYLKNQSIDPYFLVTCTWKPENWLTSYSKWSKHLLLPKPIKPLGTANHQFCCCKINSP